MSYPNDLLEQARHLARRESRRPKQASLRRAVSAAYYALFHLLTEEGARLVCRGRHLQEMRPVIQRVFDHGTMKKMCNRFDQGGFPGPWNVYGGALPDDIRRVARIFVELQEKRHAADYDAAQSFSKHDVDQLIARTGEAFDCWERAKRKHRVLAGLFLLALLFGERVRR